MSRTMKLICLAALLLLDVVVVEPWLQAAVPAPAGVERAWFFLIPMAISAIAAIAKARKQKAAEEQALRDKLKPGSTENILKEQRESWQQTQPQRQAILSMASGMMPTYMKQPGGGLDQWQRGYEERAGTHFSGLPARPSYQRPPTPTGTEDY
jgi:hypothetical protein